MRRMVMIVVVGLLAVLVPQSAHAATYVVDSLGDGPDANLGNGVCATAQGVCTLRAALQQANASVESDVITVPAGTITVATKLPISSRVSIVGAGAGSTVITATGQMAIEISNVTGEVLLQDLAVAGSVTSGGVILQTLGAPKTTFNRVRVANNTVAAGGVTNGTVTVTSGSFDLVDSSITNNTVSVPTSTAYASGLWITGPGVTGRIENSTIADNVVKGQTANFGGLAVGPGAQALLRYATVVGNAVQGTFGGVGPTLSNYGTLTVDNSVIGDAVPFGSSPTDNCVDVTPITFTGRNVISDESCGLANANRVIAPLGLAPAASNAKGTVSRVPVTGGPAINVADCAGGADQRAVARPQGVRCDAGAVEASADPAVGLSASAQSVPTGGEVSFIAQVTNSGPDTLAGLVLAVAAGNGTFTTALGCTVGSELTCPLDLAPGASSAVQFSVRSGSPGPMPVTATLRNLLPDPAPGNNTASVTVSVAGESVPAACSVLTKGTKKADRLRGSAAGDRLLGRGGNDRLKGLAGDDCLNGGKGKDRLVAGSGNDQISARDGQRDVIRCGTGQDTVVVDKRDRIAKDCEKRRR